MSKSPFNAVQIVNFVNPKNGIEYDGIVWRILKEDETNYSLVIRFVDEV